MTKANFKKMAFFGPKTLTAKGDTVYYSVSNLTYNTCWTKILKDKDTTGKEVVTKIYKCNNLEIDTLNYPIYCILFLNEKLRSQGYKLNGLIDYVKYKSKELKQIPVFFVSKKIALDELNANIEDTVFLNGDFDSIPIKLDNFISVRLTYSNLDSLLKKTYFKQKPYYVFDYFIALVDKQRHIRGYYDPTFNAEITRMIADYKHLKIRDGYAQTQKQNEIEQH